MDKEDIVLMHSEILAIKRNEKLHFNALKVRLITLLLFIFKHNPLSRFSTYGMSVTI